MKTLKLDRTRPTRTVRREYPDQEIDLSQAKEHEYRCDTCGRRTWHASAPQLGCSVCLGHLSATGRRSVNLSTFKSLVQEGPTP